MVARIAVILCLLIVGPTVAAGPPSAETAETRAVAFLSREVPALVAREPLLLMSQQR